jgi:hypothetical protein
LELTGKRLALVGSFLCAGVFVSSILLHVTSFAASVPEGYERISFEQLRSDLKGDLERVPESALQLNGKKVYIHGYLHPSVDSGEPVQRFVIVGEFSICCFGGQPKMTDMIMVHTTPDARVSYGTRMVKLAGKFDIGDQPEEFAGVKDVVYQLEAHESR